MARDWDLIICLDTQHTHKHTHSYFIRLSCYSTGKSSTVHKDQYFHSTSQRSTPYTTTADCFNQSIYLICHLNYLHNMNFVNADKILAIAFHVTEKLLAVSRADIHVESEMLLTVLTFYRLDVFNKWLLYFILLHFFHPAPFFCSHSVCFIVLFFSFCSCFSSSDNNVNDKLNK